MPIRLPHQKAIPGVKFTHRLKILDGVHPTLFHREHLQQESRCEPRVGSAGLVHMRAAGPVPGRVAVSCPPPNTRLPAWYESSSFSDRAAVLSPRTAPPPAPGTAPRAAVEASRFAAVLSGSASRACWKSVSAVRASFVVQRCQASCQVRIGRPSLRCPSGQRGCARTILRTRRGRVLSQSRCGPASQQKRGAYPASGAWSVHPGVPRNHSIASAWRRGQQGCTVRRAGQRSGMLRRERPARCSSKENNHGSYRHWQLRRDLFLQYPLGHQPPPR